MFGPLMINTWIAATAVAVIAGVTGFFAVLRGSTFAAHAIPNGAFAGAAGASLLGLNPFAGLAVFSLAGALGIAGLSRRARSDVATALVTVWASIALSYRSDWPLGFFVGLIGAVSYLLGRAYRAAVTRSARGLQAPPAA
jgi:ABC-type Mn2+/Zn2+ transport system permease subunit